MDKQKIKVLLISDCNMDILAGYLNNNPDAPEVSTAVAPFGQVMPALIEQRLEYWQDGYGLAIVWTRPEAVIESFASILNYQLVLIDEILRQVDQYAQALISLQERVRFVFVPRWVVPTYHRGYGMLEMKSGIGIENTLLQMNLRLAENLSQASNIYLLDAQDWIIAAGKGAFNPKLWYLAKIPFANPVFKEAAGDIKAALRGIAGEARKLIILDLDDTIWGGIVGDLGWENIRLGGHDYIGEAYIDFQRALKALNNRGILLAIVSKNEEEIALEAVNNHPEMVLKLSDFAGWRINWRDKVQNIIDLVADLKLGLQSAVFIDDNPFERARIKDALPEVLVPEWPEDKMLYKKTLLSLNCFDTPGISKEDLTRTKMYAVERKRQDSRKKIISLNEWLKTLEIKITVEKLNQTNLQRTAQLLNKTNQMNLSTRRMTESELMNWAGQANHKLWTFRVVDKFGDSGLTSIISLSVEKNKVGRIVDFVLSCRVLGREIEKAMLYMLVDYAQSISLDEIYAKYILTSKNKPCLDFWKKSGFTYQKEEDTFKYGVNSGYPLPECIQIGGDWRDD